MSGLNMAESLLLMEKDSLRFNYALLHDSNILKMLLPFAKEKLSKSKKSEIMEMINDEANKYKYTPTPQLKRGLLKELGDLYNIPHREYVVKQDIVDQCERIIDRMFLDMKSSNKKFKAFLNNSNLSENPLDAITKYQMMNLIESIGDHKFDPRQMKEVGDSLEEFFNDLPETQQKRIAEKLGINNITSSSIQQLIATNGTAVVFAAIVQVAGFAFYTTLTSVVAGIFGFVGITLPFVFYTTMTSLVAVVANPLIFLPALLIGGSFLLHKQNIKMKKAISPVVLMQILTSADSGKEPEWEEILNG
ncbi:hypothetical protein BN1080_02846 [Planococcus massiliensis]|uniref:Uncharacterized protein n=1 Tax=Planococcus massiliensis TaxID=1499687 RepID=A0A098ENH5_9BACL|nr:hypothetical protein [Planococcus massiliensis]CEG23839.1 hypothetical protein BN1080_02846 [Planococcus massiliensis]